MWQWFVQRTDGYIALTPGGRMAALERFPELEARPGFVIPHGHYRDAYPDRVSGEDARTALGLPGAARVAVFLGTIRPYKNIPELIDVFRRVPGDEWRLVIAGKPATGELRAAVTRAVGADPRVRLDLDFVAAERVQLYLRAADLVVLPYRDILNSGSALLALSFGRPVLVPERGAMAELQRAAGPEWVRTYWGELLPETLIAAMIWAVTAKRAEARLLRELDWDEIAQQTVLAYQAVLRTPAATPRSRPDEESAGEASHFRAR